MVKNLVNFLKTWAILAQSAFNRGLCRWKLQPKFHMAGEVCFTLQHDKAQNAPSMCPLSYATQMDEDFVGRVANFSRTVSSRTLAVRTIKKYLLRLKAQW